MTSAALTKTILYEILLILKQLPYDFTVNIYINRNLIYFNVARVRYFLSKFAESSDLTDLAVICMLLT